MTILQHYACSNLTDIVLMYWLNGRLLLGDTIRKLHCIIVWNML